MYCPDTLERLNSKEVEKLILAAWTVPGMYKTIRLREHIQWAGEHGALEEVYAFLKGLPELAWHHFDD